MGLYGGVDGNGFLMGSYCGVDGNGAMGLYDVGGNRLSIGF